MAGLVLPPRLLMEERKRREAQALIHLQRVTDDFNRELQRIDPALCLVFCQEPAPLEVVAAGARPGRFNIMREPSNGGPLTFMPIVGPAGEFVEPTSRIFEMLKAMDWWNPEVMRHRRELDGKLEDARRKREADELREMDELVLERWNAVSRAQVSMNRDVPWAQNHAGERAAKADAKRREKK